MADTEPGVDTKYPVQLTDTLSGPGSRTPPERVVTVLELYRSGHSLHAIGQTLGMDERTIKGIINRDRKAQALATLDEAIPKAAQAWTEAMVKAAALGKHVPARDLLVSRGVIEPVPVAASAPSQTQIGIKIVLGTESSPLPDIDVVGLTPVQSTT